MKTKTIFTILIIGVCLIHTLFLYNKDKDNKIIQTSVSQTKYEILVDVEESKLYVFENEELIKTYSCSGGKWSTPSPIGTWTIVSKQLWGEGFGGSWMGLNVPWGQFRNTWNHRSKFSRLGKFTWLYKNEK